MVEFLIGYVVGLILVMTIYGIGTAFIFYRIRQSIPSTELSDLTWCVSPGAVLFITLLPMVVGLVNVIF